jgi:hypothetical protein
MRKRRWEAVLVAAAALVVVAVSSTPAHGAVLPGTGVGRGNYASSLAVQQVWTLTETNQGAWAHQCAASHCGFHTVGAFQHVIAWCSTFNEGLWWDLVTTASPWDSRLPIAGYVVAYALTGSSPQPCGSVGTGGFPFVAPQTWAHSCPLLGCGFGIMWPFESVAGVCSTPLFEGHTWVMVVDHDSADSQLAGFVHAEDFPRSKPDVTCYWNW